MKTKIGKNLNLLIALVLFASSIWVLHVKLKDTHPRDIVRQLRQFPGMMIWLAGLFTVLNYWILTWYDTLALRYLKHRLAYPKIMLASFIGYVFSHNTTVLGGTAARFRIYSNLGLNAEQIARLILFCAITFWVGFLSLGGFVFTWYHQAAPSAIHLPGKTLLPLGLLMLALAGGYLVIVGFGRRELALRGWTFELPTLRLALLQVVISVGDWLCAAAVLYLLIQPVCHLSYSQFLGFFLLAQIGGILSAVPAGLGVFDSVLLLLLSQTVAPNVLAGSLLLYRLIYYLIPLLAGSILLGLNEALQHVEKLSRAARWASGLTAALVPVVFSLGSFMAGLILLFSGTLPAVKGRLEILNHFIPLSGIEFSPFYGQYGRGQPADPVTRSFTPDQPGLVPDGGAADAWDGIFTTERFRLRRSNHSVYFAGGAAAL